MTGSPADLLALLCEPAVEVAPRLLGAVLTVGKVSVRLTEVEAYGGADDPGSHAFRGPTRRNATMFGPPARLYCYLSYGLHTCANVVCGPEGEASAVLLRAGEVVAGALTARSRRSSAPDRDLARGPGRLGQALGVTLDDDGGDLHGPRLVLEPAAEPTVAAVGPRVGLRLAANLDRRFWVPGDPTVSAYRRHPKAAPPS